jgi:hypothetical protein
MDAKEEAMGDALDEALDADENERERDYGKPSLGRNWLSIKQTIEEKTAQLDSALAERLRRL